MGLLVSNRDYKMENIGDAGARHFFVWRPLCPHSCCFECVRALAAASLLRVACNVAAAVRFALARVQRRSFPF